MSRGSILILEDEKNLAETLLQYLKDRGFHCLLASSIAQARAIYNELKPSILLVDIGLPDGSGLDFAKEIRQKSKNIVILFLSALNDPEIRLKGLEIGALDYITKPFQLKELHLRLDRILSYQESIQDIPDDLLIGNLKISFSKYEVVDAYHKTIQLSQKECAILKLLFHHQNNVISRDNIIDEVWGDNSFPSNRTVDNYIVSLRKWCDTDPNKSISITSIRGIGYKLEIKK